MLYGLSGSFTVFLGQGVQGGQACIFLQCHVDGLIPRKSLFRGLSAEVQRDGCEALAGLASHQNGADLARIADAGGIEVKAGELGKERRWECL